MLNKFKAALKDMFLWSEPQDTQLRIEVKKLYRDILREIKTLDKNIKWARENEDADMLRYSQGSHLSQTILAGKLKDILDNG